MSKAITGLFTEVSQAVQVVDELLAKGADPEKISVLASETVGQEEFGIQPKTKVAEGVAIGTGVGGSIGALTTGFAAAGVLASTGVGLIAAGPLVAALAGAGAGAAGGSVLGGLVGLGIDEHQVKLYEDAVKEGSVLVGVDEGTLDTDTIKAVFERHDAKNVSSA